MHTLSQYRERKWNKVCLRCGHDLTLLEFEHGHSWICENPQCRHVVDVPYILYVPPLQAAMVER